MNSALFSTTSLIRKGKILTRFYLILFAFAIGCKEVGTGSRRVDAGDTSAPTIPIVAAVSPAGPANNNSPVVTGTAEANSTIWLYSNSTCTTLIGSGSTDASGNFTATASVADDSSTSIYARAADAAGNTSACSVTFASYNEVTAPLARPVLLSSSPAGPSTNNNPVINGTAVSGQTVTLYSNATCSSASLGSVGVGGSGTFNIPIAVNSNVTTNVYAKATLGADYSACSTTFVSYVEDSTPPSLPNVSGMSPASPANHNSPSILGTAEANVGVNLYSDSSCSASLGTGTANSNGYFSISISVANNTSTSIYARAFDAAGNYSPCTTTLISYIEDSTAPGPPTLIGSTPASPANNNAPLISGTTDPHAIVTLYSDSSCSDYLATGSADASGNFGVSIGVADDSITTVYARAIDASGNPSGCSVSSYTYAESSNSFSPPVMVSSSPSGTANNNSPIILGLATPSSNIELFTDSSCTTSIATGTVDGSGNFAIGITVANDTSTTVYGRIESSGTFSTCSSTFVTYNEDSTAPALPVVSNSSPVGPANNNSPLINGSAEPNSTVQLYSNNSCSSLLATGTANGSGNYSISISVADDTTTSVYARAVDAASNASGCSTTFVSYQELSTSVNVPTLVSSSPLSPSNNNSPSISGTAEAGRGIELFSNSTCTTLIASGTANGSGNFSIPITVIADSTTTIYAKANNGAGVYSPCSTSFVTYVEDSIAPALPVVSSSSPAGPANDNNPIITGTAEANSFISLFSNNTCTASLMNGSANGSGSFSITITVSDDSTTNVYARATDSAGNASGCSTTSVSYVEASTALATPTVTSASPVGPANNNSPTISGTADAGRAVQLFSNNTCTTLIGSGTADGTGNFVIAASVADNSVTSIYAKSNNGAGIYSACSPTSVTYTEDSAAPGIPSVTNSSPISPANNNSPSISGSAEANSSVTLYSDNTCVTSLGTGTASVGGAFTIAIATVDNSTTNIYARATDAAGNTSNCSTILLTYIEDSIAPAAPTIASTSPAVRSSKTNIDFIGTAEGSSTVKIYSNSGCTSLVSTGSAAIGGSFTIAATVGLDAILTYYATATDSAGNVSSCSTTGISYEAYSIPIGIGSFASTQTNAVSAGTDPNQSTAASFQWSSGEFDYDFFSHSTSSNSHQITVKQAGDYQLSLTLPVNIAATAAAVITEVRVNGVVRSNGRAQTSYILNANGQTEASANPTIFLNGLGANDVIDITTIRAGAAGTMAISGAVKLFIENIAASRTIFYATASRTVSSTNLNGVTASSLQWTDNIKDIGFTHSNSISTENITLDTAGTYVVHLNIPLSASLTNASVQAQIQLNGATVTGGLASQGFIGNNSGNTTSSVHFSGVVRSTTANQVLTIKTMQKAVSGTVTVPAGRVASVSIEKLPSTVDTFYGYGTSLVSGTDFNAATASPVTYTTAPIKDALVFTHSTASEPQEVTVNTAGDYVLMFNSILVGSGQRQNQIMEVAVDGVAVPGAQTKSFLVRNTNGHIDVSGTMVIYLRKLNPGQKVTVTVEKEGANGTTTSTNTSLVLIRKPY